MLIDDKHIFLSIVG